MEFWIGEGDQSEQCLISKPTIVLVPKNMVHLPLNIREVHNPFLAITVLDTPLAGELPVENFPSGFKKIA